MLSARRRRAAPKTAALRAEPSGEDPTGTDPTVATGPRHGRVLRFDPMISPSRE